MKCPHCQGKLTFFVDSVTEYKIIQGRISSKGTTHELDNHWIECLDCGKCSDSDLTLSELLTELE